MQPERPPQLAREPRTERIIERVRAIPEGYVRTFGDIEPAAPRLVGRILATHHDLPWHRVVRADARSHRAKRNGGCSSPKAC
jgi:methylated-DNA-protein-cysteine methyltransferase related protein